MMNEFSMLMFSAIKPEIILAVVGMILLIYGAFKGQTSLRFVMGAVIVAFLLSALTLVYGDNSTFDTLGGMIIQDDFAVTLKIAILFGLAASLFLAEAWLRENNVLTFEYPVLVLLSGIGMMLMTSATNFLSLYVSLELSSLGLYVLASIRRDHLVSTEAGLKYFILGALSSGLLLFGISLVYGYTGSLQYAEIAAKLAGLETSPVGVLVGAGFIMAGLCFKISAVPFHMWTPDVYEGAPTPVTALFAIVPKVAAFALIIRLVIGPFASISQEVGQILLFISLASMVVGSFAGLVQNNIKRLLAYSSIANMGYALIGLIPGTPDGVASVILYLFIYMIMVAGVFAVLMSLKKEGQAVENIPDFAGLSKQDPFKAYVLTALLFSMSGIPPLAGFFAKFFVFQTAVAAGYYIPAVIGVLTSVVGAYYYLRLIKVMFFDEAAKPFDAECVFSRRIVALVSLAFILLFTFFPNELLAEASRAAVSLFPLE